MRSGLDQVTKRVLAVMARDGTADMDHVAREAGCTEEVARARLDRLRAHGVLRGVRLDLDPARLDRPHEVLVTGVPTADTDQAALQALCRGEGVTRVFTLASRASVAFTVRGQDPVDLEARALAMAVNAGLEHARSTLVVKTMLDDPLHGVQDVLPPMAAAR